MPASPHADGAESRSAAAPPTTAAAAAVVASPSMMPPLSVAKSPLGALAPSASAGSSSSSSSSTATPASASYFPGSPGTRTRAMSTELPTLSSTSSLSRPESPGLGTGGVASSPRSALASQSHFTGGVRRGGGWRQSWNPGAASHASSTAGSRTRTTSTTSVERASASPDGAPAHVSSGGVGHATDSSAASQSNGSSSPDLPLNAAQAGVMDLPLACSEGLERSVWDQPTLPVATPPGAIIELPSDSGAMSPASHLEYSDQLPPWSAAAGAKAGDYDWANFVYAYARGRFDPLRLPWPPSQSTAFPGSTTSIVVEQPVSPKSAPTTGRNEPPPLPEDAPRRPSLSYSTSDGLLNNVENAKSPAGPALSHTPGVDAGGTWWPGARLFAPSRTPPPSVTAFEREATRQQSLPPHATNSLRASTTGALPSPPASLSGDALNVLQLTSSSSPDIGMSSKRGEMVLDKHGSPIGGTKSVPELSGNKMRAGSKQSLSRKSSEGKQPDTSIWHSSAAPRTSDASTVSASRPSLEAQVSDLKLDEDHAGLSSIDEASSRQTLSSGSSTIDAPTVTQGLSAPALTSNSAAAQQAPPRPHLRMKPGGDRTAAELEAAAQALAHARPGPTPVQHPALPDAPSEVPSTWGSAPEGSLTSFNTVLSSQGAGRSAAESPTESATRFGDLGDGTTVAGLRRAARRASARRTDRPPRPRTAERPRDSAPHSQSFHGTEQRKSFGGSAFEEMAADGYIPLVDGQSRDKTIGHVQSDGEEDSPGASWRAEAGLLEGGRRACPMPGTRSRTASDAQQRSKEYKEGLPGTAQQSAGVNPSVNAYLNVGRRVENFYGEFGYLPAIVPPNDMDRRQALRRYGPPNIASDVNFERVAHLVKLVFNTKLVLVSLVNETTQHFRTQSGASSSGFTPEWLQAIASSRNCSFCSHAILQDNDEPFVVLDTHKDWRFAGNPLVVKAPKIRFYAGAPLRTADGFNLGSLCIIDDRPWTEFNPRQRHTLREFARVVMREMELARDTIHLRIRDRMQHSIEHFTRECLEMEATDNATEEETPGLHQVYEFAAKGMREALQASGAIIFDLSHFELVDSPAFEGEDGTSKIFFPSPYQNPEAAPFASFDNPSNIEVESTLNNVPADGAAQGDAREGIKDKAVPPMAVLGASETCEPPPDRDAPVPLAHYIKVAEFLRRHRTGCYYPFTPAPFRHLLPPGMTNLLLVPIFGLNKQPFALLCAYSKPTENGPQLQDIKDSGLQYLRAMGTIILSAILKKDIMLADKAKSHFISNISHELRTPLHGILAAAELLAETKINATQGSYLETVEACGKSLLELVNHVLDFTKLSGNTRANKAPVKPTQRCDLVKLVQEVCESSWIGQMARKLESQQSSGIGSAYAHGSGSSTESVGPAAMRQSIGRALGGGSVETVIDIMMREDGWLVQCDAAGIRRVLMNLIGNSLKFTTEGFVHVSLREIQSTDTHIVVELGVTDTGKGISRAFLEEQLFHPFTQENHLGPGTGLGLSIVNSIVQSPAINGKIDVWSTLGQGTEMRVTCELELTPAAEAEGPIYRPALNVQQQHSVSLQGFTTQSRGHVDLKEVMRSYFEDWWHFKIVETAGDLILINEDVGILHALSKQKNAKLPPAVVLTSARGDPEATSACDAYHRAGGVARLLFKPAGPAKLEALVDFCLQCLERMDRGEPALGANETHDMVLPSPLPSPHTQQALERKDTYFAPLGKPSGDDETPQLSTLTPRASAHHNHGHGSDSSSSLLDPHHMSPGPPSMTEAGSLLRRHSDHDRTVRFSHSSNSHTPSSLTPNENAAAPDGSSRQNRPTLPARSITYHEPRLQRHVHMSPHHARRRDSTEPQDYFGTGAVGGCATSNSSHAGSQSGASHYSASSPSSPGSTISLEGGDGAVLKTALQGSRSTHGKKERRMHILSIEDNSINRRVLAAFLSKMDVDFVEASNGEEGVRAFEAHPPQYFDVILMDLSMPVLDGISATAQIRKIEAERFRAAHSGGPAPSAWRGVLPRGPGVGTPGGSRPTAQSRAKIFALTGHSSDEDKRRAFATGADGFIVKPLSFKILSSLLKMLAYQD